MTQTVAMPVWKGTVIPVREDKTIRCPGCNRLLMKGELGPGSRIQVKCPRAGCNQLLSFARM